MAFFLSSRSVGHAAAATLMPVAAMETIMRDVVLPPPRSPAVTKKSGRVGNKMRSMMLRASAIKTHFPSGSVATSQSHSSVRNLNAAATVSGVQSSVLGMKGMSAGSIRNTARRSRSSPLRASGVPSGRTRGMVSTA